MTSRTVDASNQDYRGLFHYSPCTGWLNDPNGFSWFKDRYHLFFQYHPHNSIWGPMHWGHAVSTDLVRWEHLPIALSPGESYDADGCFSGSAVEQDGSHVLMYTGHVNPDPRDRSLRREVQCLARGDGLTYRKIPENPVIGSDLLPPGASLGDFRDPKVWRESGRWYCLCTSRHRDGDGQLLLFESEDMIRWHHVGVTLRSEGRLGATWECPDFFSVDGHEALMWSVHGKKKEEGRFQNPCSVVWATGTLDRAAGSFTPQSVAEVDHGPDFYAPQTLVAPDGRVIMIAWMQMWERSYPTHDLNLGWAGQMTIPREISWTAGHLLQNPVRELEAYRGPEVARRATLGKAERLEGVHGPRLDLELDFRVGSAEAVGLRFFIGEGEETVVRWEPRTGWLSLDRSRGGVPIVSTSSTHPECQAYKARVEAPGGALRLRVVLDRPAVEVFAQGGSTAMSATVYPSQASDGIEFFAEGGDAELRCRAWPLLTTGSDR